MEPLPCVAELQTTIEKHTEAVSTIIPYGPSQWLSCAWDGHLVLWKGMKPPFEVHEELPCDTSRPLTCACEIGGKTIVRANVDGVVEAWELVPIAPPPDPDPQPPPAQDPKAKKATPAKASQPPPPPEPVPEEWKVVHTLKPESIRVTALLHVHGKLFVAYASGSVFVYEIHLEQWGERPVGTLHHPTSVTALLHMEENAVVSACTDRRIRIWDMGTLVCLATLQGHQSAVTCLTRNDDGRLFSGAGDGSVIVWKLIRPPVAEQAPDAQPPEPDPPPPPPQGKHAKPAKNAAAHGAQHPAPANPPAAHAAPPAPPAGSQPHPAGHGAAEDGGAGGEDQAHPPAEPPHPPLGSEWEKEAEFKTGDSALRSLLWTSGMLVCGDSAATLKVWNHRPLRADEPDHRAWVQERSTLDGMGPGPVGCLTKLGRRMFAGGSDGGIRVYM